MSFHLADLQSRGNMDWHVIHSVELEIRVGFAYATRPHRRRRRVAEAKLFVRGKLPPNPRGRYLVFHLPLRDF